MALSIALRPGRSQPGVNRRIGRLFMAGSACFAIASLPAASSLSENAVALVYFIGSIFFTTAGAEAYRTSAPEDRLDFISSAVTLAGTIFFNISTFTSLDARLDERSSNLLVWSPDIFGSIAFLIASAIALVAVRQMGGIGPEAVIGRRIAVFNMIGSVAFGISALAAYVIPNTGEAINAAAASSLTLIGALCFFYAAYLLVPRERSERSRPSASRPARAR